MKRKIRQLILNIRSNQFLFCLLRSFLTLAIVPIVVTSIVSYLLCYNAILSNSVATSREINDYATDSINQIQDTSENITTSLIHSTEIQIAMRYRMQHDSSSNLITAYHINSLLKSIKDSSNSNISGIYLINKEGICYQSNTTSDMNAGQEKNLCDTKWYKSVIEKKEAVWFSPHEDSFIKDYNDVQLIGYGVPYIDYLTKEPIGVILIELDAPSFFSSISNNDEMGFNTYYVLNNAEKVIYSSNTDDVKVSEIKKIEKDKQCYINELKNGWKIVGVISTGEIGVRAILQLSVGIIVVLIASLFLAVSFSVKQAQNISKPIRSLIENMKIVQKGNYDVEIPIPESSDEIIALYKNYNKLIYKSNEYMDQIKIEQENLRKANFKALQAQINPHFLYNTMDTIAWNIRLNENEKAINAIVTLTKFFRSSLRKGEDVVTLEKEMEQVSLYFQIQMYRYEDMLDYSIDYDNSLAEYLIPKLTLQPIVENAIYHGIKYKDEGGFIKITTEIKEGYYVIRVVDDGQGMPKEQVEKLNEQLYKGIPGDSDTGGYGIYNVNERIKTYFGKEYGLSYSSKENQFTCVTIKLPIRNSQMGDKT